MTNYRSGALVALDAALIVSASSITLGVLPAHAAPPPPCPPATDAAGNPCTARLSSVTANTADGTITGTPVGGGAPITLSGNADAYLKSQGFGDAPPVPIQRWDAAIGAVNAADPSGPNWYGDAKSRAFLPRSLDDLATQFPPGVLVVRFVPDDTHPGWFRLVSIQPMAR